MTRDLVVGGGGSTAVATDEMLEHAQVLERLSVELDECRRRFVAWPLAEEVDARVTNHAVWARGAIEEAGCGSAELARSLRRAAENYGRLERSLSLVGQAVGAQAAYFAGLLLPGMIAAHGPAVVVTLMTASGVLSAAGAAPGRGFDPVTDWLRANPRVVNNPLVVSLTRTAVSSVDDFGMGAIFVPPSARQLFGDEGFGVVGLPVAGATILGMAGGVGLLRETPVEVRRVHESAGAGPAGTGAATPRTVLPPRGFGDLAGRIPTPEPDGAQVVIEKYVDADGGNRYAVFVAGTIDSSPSATTEPWDLTSDVRAVVGSDSAAVRAAELAMVEAGIGQNDPVLIAGYSLGGIVAREVAERGTFAVQDVVTLGAPVGQIALSDGVSAVSVEHNEDLIAAMGGHPRSPAEGGLEPLVVRRFLFDELDGSADEVFAAHGLDDYRETARLMDASGEARVVESRDRLSGFFENTSGGEVSRWRADRVIPPTGR